MTYPQLDLANVKGTKITIQTNHGDIKVQLIPFFCTLVYIFMPPLIDQYLSGSKSPLTPWSN